MLYAAVPAYAKIDHSLSGEFDRYLIIHLFAPLPVLIGATFALALGAPATRLEFKCVTISTRRCATPMAFLSSRAARNLNIGHLLPNWGWLHIPVPDTAELPRWARKSGGADNDNQMGTPPKM